MVAFGIWQYTADDNTYKTNIRIEINAGTQVNGAPPGGLTEMFPPARTKLRKVDLVLVSGTGAKRKRIPCIAANKAIWTATSPPNVTIGSGTYKVAGRVGEKRF